MTVLEHVVTRAALALHLTDLATGRPVVDGISADAWPAARPELAVPASTVTAAGVAGFRALPGLRPYEDGSTDRDAWFASPVSHPPLPFVVRVRDATGLHHRAIREVLVPAATPVGVALARSTAAPLPPGTLAVSADLVTEAGAPAAWALVEIVVGALTVGGIADERGTVTVPVPRSVSPTSAGTSATGPRWTVTVRVRYRPVDQLVAPGSDAGDPPTVTSLLAQPPASVAEGGAFVAGLQRDLDARGPLVVVSAPPPADPVVIVRPAP